MRFDCVCCLNEVSLLFQIFSKVVPLIEAHKELVAELKQFLYQPAPLSE